MQTFVYQLLKNPKRKVFFLVQCEIGTIAFHSFGVLKQIVVAVLQRSPSNTRTPKRYP